MLERLNLSRVAFAQALAVDKSLVGRWASGAIAPSDHNLARISAHVAASLPGFTMADWHRDPADFARSIGIEPPDLARAGPVPPGFPPSFIAQCRSVTAQHGAAYEGFWQTSRPSILMKGSIFRDRGMIRIDDQGFMTVRMGGAGVVFEGVILPNDQNLFAIFYSAVNDAPYFLIAKGVRLPRADAIEGLLLLAALDSDGTPAAVPIVLERTGDLSGDRDADDRRCADLIQSPPIATEGEVSGAVLARLIRDVGPAAAQKGGDMFLTTALGNLSRGSTFGGLLSG